MMLGIKSMIPSKQLSSPDNIEAVVVEINCGKPTVVCVLYISPSAGNAYHIQVLNFLRSLSLENDLILLGDFNYPDIDWNSYSGSSSQSSDFCDLISELNLRQLVVSPTHRAGNILDLILTNNDQIIHDIVVYNTLPSDLSSDHFIILFEVLLTRIPQVGPPCTSTYNYSKANWIDMINYLTDYDFSDFTT